MLLEDGRFDDGVIVPVANVFGEVENGFGVVANRLTKGLEEDDKDGIVVSATGG